MLTLSLTFDRAILYFVAFNALAILLAWMVVRYRARCARNEATLIAGTIQFFFRQSGSEVAVTCVGAAGTEGHTVVIDTGSSKRFRHSHVIEVLVTNYVREKCKLALHRIYWRFPIDASSSAKPAEAPPTPTAPTPAAASAETVDDYQHAGRARLKQVAGYEVTESSLEAFQAFARKSAATDDAKHGHAMPAPASGRARAAAG